MPVERAWVAFRNRFFAGEMNYPYDYETLGGGYGGLCYGADCYCSS